jgi:hypothetical protein
MTFQLLFCELAPGVNFSNILGTSFARAEPKITKKTYGYTVLFVFLESSHVKAG